MHSWAQIIVSVIAPVMVVGCTASIQVGNRGGSSSSMAWAEIIERSADPAVVTNAQMLAKINASGLPWRVRDKASGIEMLLVPSGEFAMGMSPGDMLAMVDERPAHPVVISKPFYLGRTEVTQGQWSTVMGYNPSYFQEANYKIENSPEAQAKVVELMNSGFTRDEAEKQAGVGSVVRTEASTWPIETVTPDELEPFLIFTGLRLPTEAEWEYACRAGLRAPRYGEIDDIAWYTGNSERRSHPVGTKLPNALGFYDMIGSVWEWVSDWYSADYYAECGKGATDPTGPAETQFRVARGGSWDQVEKNCRASYRQNHFMPDPRITDFGFRVARNP